MTTVRDRPRARRGGRARPDAGPRARVRHPARGAAELRPRLGRRATGTRTCASPTRSRSSAQSAPPGIRTIIDPTAPGLGRCIPRIQRINEEVDLNIVVATGVYAFLELPNFLHYRSAEAIAELFVREIREGIDDTGVKAAFLKCAVEEHGLVGDIPKILDAVAMAAQRDGRAGHGAHERERLDGDDRPRSADLERVSIRPGSSSPMRATATTSTYLRTIGDTGATLGFDRFNIPHFNPDADRIRTLLVLLEEGYGDRIHLSHDAACFMDFMVGDPNFAGERPDYLHISSKVLPALREHGVTDAQIDELTIDNPRRFLAPARVAA